MSQSGPPGIGPRPNHKGPVMQQPEVRQRKYQSDVPTMYTRGGIKHDKTSIIQLLTGWSSKGIVWNTA
jgi:hypothetical protein